MTSFLSVYSQCPRLTCNLRCKGIVQRKLTGVCSGRLCFCVEVLGIIFEFLKGHHLKSAKNHLSPVKS
jgi:hypothetical protein